MQQCQWVDIPYSCSAAFLVINFNGQLGLITVYALGIPLLLAVYKWIEWYKQED